jgi:spermidine dehydrogenase
MGNDVTRIEFRDGSSYPPARSGMRGSHPGSFDVAHAIRDGSAFEIDGLPLEEPVDLVVVGAGISGLAAAWFYRRRRPDATILLLDNHDDFGGHAKRNELHVGDRLLIGYGGSEAMQSPNALYSEVARGLIEELGVDIARFETAFDRDLYPGLGLSRGLFFTREAFGTDVLVPGDPIRMVADDIPADRMNERPAEAFVADFPVSDGAKRALIELFSSSRNPLPGRTPDEVIALLSSTSYRDYVMTCWGLDDEAADTFQGRPHDFFAMGIDRVSAYDAFGTGYPGFAGLGLPIDPETAAEMEEPYIYHFPDGNASLARLMVRSLIPSVAPGDTMEDVVTAAFDYGRLDDAASPTRLRLESTAVSVRNRDRGVDVGYVRDGELRVARATHAVLAGYHMMIPSIMPELPAPQKRALAKNTKAPLVYVKVAVRDWHPWVRLGVHEITNPMGFFSRVKLDYPVSLGDYRCPRSPDEPIMLHLVHVPAQPGGGTARRRFRDGRTQLFELGFADFEREIRDELARMLGPGGFDADRDIAGIVVNRWGHGYSYFGDPLLGPDAEEPPPYLAARERAGDVAFANADAAWTPFAHAAIDQAHRAVGDLLDPAG